MKTQKIALSLKQQSLILLFCLVLSGLVSVYLGKDLSWDLANYHYYNPFAFLTKRSNIDYWPVSFIHAFLVPTLDFYSYWAIKTFPPLITEFIFGFIHGLNIWLTFLIATQLIMLKNNISTIIFCLFLGLLGNYSALVIPGIGGFENDNTVSIFVLAFIFFQIKHWQQYAASKQLNFSLLSLSGLLLGLGIGNKLTLLIFLIGTIACISILSIPVRQRIQTLIILGASIFAGILITSGYWMWLLWQQYQNPLFPFFNNIFHSPYFTEFNHTWYLPKSRLQQVFYPLIFSVNGSLSDGPFQDLRFGILFILCCCCGMAWLWQKFKNKTLTYYCLSEQWLMGFVIFSYIPWVLYFSIVRYIAAIAMIAPILIYILSQKLFTNQTARTAILFLFYYLIIITLLPPDIIRLRNYTPSFFNVRMPSTVQAHPNALVLMAYSAYALTNQPKPQTYLIPHFPTAWHFVGIPFTAPDKVHFEHHEEEKIGHIIANYPQQIYLLASERSIYALLQTAKNYGLIADGWCQLIYSDRQYVSNSDTFLCPMKKRRS